MTASLHDHSLRHHTGKRFSDVISSLSSSCTVYIPTLKRWRNVWQYFSRV